MYCTYCGERCDEKEHVVPKSYKKNNNTVPACRECNSTLGAVFYHTVGSRAQFLLAKYKIKYRKTLRQASWSDEELSQMGFNMQRVIRLAKRQKEIAQDRLQHLAFIIELDPSIEEDLDLVNGD